MKLSKLLAAVAVTTFTLASNAGFLVEPYFSYIASGKATGTAEVSSIEVDIEGTLSGTTMGLRAGYGLPLGLGFGIDYEMGNISSKDSDGDTTKSTDTNMGAFVSFDFPVMFRTWLTYFTSKSSKGEDATSKGTGMKIGVGYTGLPFVSINLEYITDTFTESDSDLVDSLDIKGSMTAISISAPFNF